MKARLLIVSVALAMLPVVGFVGRQREAQATLPGLARSIVFARSGDVWEVNKTGSFVKRLTRGAFVERDPSMRPVLFKEVLAFASNRTGHFQIWTRLITSGVSRQVTHGPSTNIQPVWAAGGRLLFASNRSGRFQIYSINPDGTGLTKLTHHVVGSSMNPDTDNAGGFAYVWRRTGSADIVVGKKDVLHCDGCFYTSPSLRPNGTQLVVEDRVNHVIDVIDADGGNLVQIASNAGQPSWSPSGGLVAFAVQDGIVECAPDGTNPIQILTTDSPPRELAWVAGID